MDDIYLYSDARHYLQGKRHLERLAVVSFVDEVEWLGVCQAESTDSP